MTERKLPPLSILDKSFAYTPAAQHQNDPDYLRKKFEAIRAQQVQSPNVVKINAEKGARAKLARSTAR